MEKIKKTIRISETTQSQLNTLVLQENKFADEHGLRRKSEAEIVEESIKQLYLSKTSGKYQSQLFQSMQDFIVMVMDQNLKNFVSSLNQNLETNMMNYEMIKLVLYNASISTRPDVMQKVLSQYQDYEDFCKETVIEKVSKADN